MKECDTHYKYDGDIRNPPLYIRNGFRMANGLLKDKLPEAAMLIQYIESQYRNCFNKSGFGGPGQMGLPALSDVCKKYPSVARIVGTVPLRAAPTSYWTRATWADDPVHTSMVGFLYLAQKWDQAKGIHGQHVPISYAYAYYQVGACWNADGQHNAKKDKGRCGKHLSGQGYNFPSATSLSKFQAECNRIVGS